jgi:hypothetical protein
VPLALFPDAALERLVELTERETALLEQLDVAALAALHEEREPLLATLAASRPGPGSERSVARLQALARANEDLATRQQAAIRAELALVGAGRRAINAYAPGGGGDIGRGLAWLDREG